MKNLTKIEQFLKKSKTQNHLFESYGDGVYKCVVPNVGGGMLQINSDKELTFQTGYLINSISLKNCDNSDHEYKGLNFNSTNLLKHLPTLKKASGFVGKDDLRPTMKGIYINSNMIAATDAHVLYKANCATSLNDEGIILDPRILILFEIAREVKISIEGLNEVIQITGENFKFTCNLIEGKYPSINAVFPKFSNYDNYMAIGANTITQATKECKKIDKHQAVFCLSEKNRLEFKNNNDGPDVNKFIEVEVKEGNNINPDEVIIMMPCYSQKHSTSDKHKFDLYQLDKIKKAVKADDYIINCYDVTKAFIVNCVSTSKPKPKTSNNTKNNNNMDLIKQIELLKAEIEKMKKEASNPEPEAKQETKQVPEPEVKQETKQVPEPEVKTIDVQIIDYSEKAIVLRGEGTKEIKDRIKKELFGKFNKFLKDSDGNKYAGWVVSVKRKDEALELIK